MMQPQASTLSTGTGDAARTIAILSRKASPAGADLPGFVWLGGYRSDMTGSKAEALCQLAGDQGRAALRFDYSGHGASGGSFREGTISRWLEESLAVFDACTSGPQILVGSSMGGWIALRMVQELRARGDGDRVAGLVLIAPAPDFTLELMEPELTDAQRQALERDGYYEEPTPYGPEPNVFTRALFEDGRKNRVLEGLIDTGAPVHIIQWHGRSGCALAPRTPADRASAVGKRHPDADPRRRPPALARRGHCPHS
ncbi:alpha/beta fold hydrolase [Hoeflea ulvae]|uniref:Palmitoyl-protein thioesterase ABHD10, mitochondrial n=1 Tax=Hoeflea ulvae TaxID=2983764 RepID=A0ABT3YB13_9HYPH|nr:alpha/beta hydrolase [Hoeflea ulvae]MCY0093058.1 alpha/beta hydrolase [Hoeflea ulvae]